MPVSANNVKLHAPGGGQLFGSPVETILRVRAGEPLPGFHKRNPARPAVLSLLSSMAFSDQYGKTGVTKPARVAETRYNESWSDYKAL